jgi:xanthine dehydrogenase accessory factor
MRETQEIALRLSQSSGPAVLATLCTVEGSSYRRPGARMLLSGGQRICSISGGCLEEDLEARARAVAQAGSAEVVVYDTAAENDAIWGVGLGCHGVIRILVEPLPPRPAWAVALAENLRLGRPTALEVVWGAPSGLGTRLASGPAAAGGVFSQTIGPAASLTIFGAGDDARPLCRMAAELGWRVAVADARPALATAARFPEAQALVVGAAGELAARAAPPPGGLAVIMTHRHAHDLPLLRALLPLPLGYLGLLGPRKRAERMLSELEAAGFKASAAMRGRLRAPAGLDLGADAPHEVALSILSEMAAALSGRDARPLRERARPIHA